MVSGSLIRSVIALVFAWLWKSAAKEKPRIEPGRQIFPSTRGIRIFSVVSGIAFVEIAIWSAYTVSKPEESWVPYLFLGFAVLAIFSSPPVLTLEVDGISSRTWFGRRKKIRWEDIASLYYNTGNNHFTVRDNAGRKITHSGLNADPEGFRNEVRRRTRLPLKVAQPGIWKAKTVEVPYEENNVS